jgi:hypothetical protein
MIETELESLKSGVVYASDFTAKSWRLRPSSNIFGHHSRGIRGNTILPSLMK